MKFVPRTISNTTFLDFGDFVTGQGASDLSKIVIDCNNIDIFYGDYMFSSTNVQKFPLIINAPNDLILGCTWLCANGNKNITEEELLEFISNFNSQNNYLHRGTTLSSLCFYLFDGSMDNILDISECLIKNNAIKHNEQSYKNYRYIYSSDLNVTYSRRLNNLFVPYDYPNLNITDDAKMVPNKLYCVSSITFETDSGTPYIARMKNQVINLCQNIGYYTQSYTSSWENYGQGYWKKENNIGYNATTLEQLKENYSTLKNREDWFIATNVKENNTYCAQHFSRYNHDSAVETINSLPDTSAYLVTSGGTNTIKFNGEAGKYTDGGAINTMTEEEIAVATAKGWTVSFT